MVKVLNAYSVNGQNNKNYYLEMSFENNGTKDVYTPSLSEVQLEDADKYVAEAGYIFSSSIDDFPSTKKLSPQQKVKGFLVFNINKSYVPVSLVLKNWNLFDNDKLVRWTILNTDIQTVDCFVDSDCSDYTKQCSSINKCTWKKGYCGNISDCEQGQACTYGMCISVN
jgi:hypothetical protein